jgi:hypothetical protein|tara:strand:- start:156 stop:260 length:105 start_codon:yes stop_codon:yes gene_type:complete
LVDVDDALEAVEVDDVVELVELAVSSVLFWAEAE